MANQKPDEFYVVTHSGSLYRASREKGEYGWPVVEKLVYRQLKGSGVLPGGRLRNGHLVWISQNCVALYDPTPKARLARDINTGLWGGHTNRPVGLFLRREGAEQCLGSDDLKAWDKRWRKQSKEVIETIQGDDLFIVDPNLAAQTAKW